MARNRMLNPEFWLDEEMAELSAYARLLYMGLWGICDDNYATLPNRPNWIKIQVFPYEEVDTTQLLGELVKSGKLIEFIGEDGNKYFYIKNFFKYQRVEKPSKPKYPKYMSSSVIVGESSTTTLAEEKITKEKKREEKYLGAANAAENKTLPKGVSTVSTVVRDKYKFTKPEASGITKAFQEKAFRYSQELGIELTKDYKSRWLKVFKEEEEGIKHTWSTDRVYSYLKDYLPKEGKNYTNDAKIKHFFWLIMNGNSDSS